MKMLSIFCFSFLCFFTIHAQKINLGIKGKKSEGELLATDSKFGDVNRFYRSVPFNLKAGQGVVFYMQSNSFTPLVVLLGNDGKTFGTLRTPQSENGKEARVAFIAQEELYPKSKSFFPRDSSFQVIFTSLEDNVTGKYTYGFKLIDSLQMVYDSHSFCSRLGYLINQRQANWDLILESVFNKVPHPDNFTKYTLMPVETGSSLTTGTGWIEDAIMKEKVSYYERMFRSSTDKDKGSAFYLQVVNDIKQCLGDKNWVFESESELKQNQNYSSILDYARHISYFYMKGAAKDQPKASFKVIWNVPLKPDEIFQYEVLLIFK